MDNSDLWFFIVALLITVIILIYIIRKKYKRITDLETELKKAKSDIGALQTRIKTYDNKIALLQADYLKFKDRLIQRATSYFKDNFNRENLSELEVSSELRKVISQVLSDYLSVFNKPDEAIIKVSKLMADYLTYPIYYEQMKMEYSPEYHVRQRALTVREIRQETREILEKQLAQQYQTEKKLAEIEKNNVFENVIKLANSNTKLTPYISKIIADIETADFEVLARSLDYGNSAQRIKQVKTIRQVKSEAKAKIENLKWAEYQLTYLLALYPNLNDVIETEYNDLQISYDNITDTDPVRNYLSTEEWKNLSTTQKNQLALDRYIESRKKSKWQIGRDYELYIGYLYQNKGYKIDYFGSYMGLEDLGRDLIATKKGKVLIIQCKYWSKEKVIHEKHIMQLYGSLIAYKIEHNTDDAIGVLITNIELSDTAKKFAKTLNIEYVENKPLGSFPRIKCNIGHDEFGETYIYHLPMDFQYDKTKIEKKGEMMVSTVAEAEEAGFRRAYKWHGNIE